MSTLGWVNNELHRGRNQPVSMILGKVKAAVDLYIYYYSLGEGAVLPNFFSRYVDYWWYWMVFSCVSKRRIVDIYL